MTAEHREGIPGYEWQDIPEFGIAVPKPFGWHYSLGTTQGMPSRGITEEPIAAGQVRGYYTGINIIVIRGVKNKYSAEQYARGFLLTRQDPLRRLSDITVEDQDPIVRSKRLFTLPHGKFVMPSGEEILLEDLTLYQMAASNKNTDTKYLATFTASFRKWLLYRQIASTMIDNMTFDKTV